VAGGTWVGAASGARVQGVWVDPLREGERGPWTGGEILADMCELSKVSRWILLEKERGDLGQWGGGGGRGGGREEELVGKLVCRVYFLTTYREERLVGKLIKTSAY